MYRFSDKAVAVYRGAGIGGGGGLERGAGGPCPLPPHIKRHDL